MQLKSFRDSPLQPGAVNAVESSFFIREQRQGLATEVFHHLPCLGQGKRPGPDFHQSKVHHEAQKPELPVFFPNRLAPNRLIHVGQRSSPGKGASADRVKPASPYPNSPVGSLDGTYSNLAALSCKGESLTSVEAAGTEAPAEFGVGALVIS